MSVYAFTRKVATNIDFCQYRPMSMSLDLIPDRSIACCPPLLHEPISVEQAERVAPMLKALADPVRLRLLSLVAAHAGSEACVCELTDAFDLSQPTISHHLKVLHDVGLLSRSKRGVWVYYAVRTETMADLGALIGGGPVAAGGQVGSDSPVVGGRR
jgi:ArsR family transcriptional regulator, arsenate/arsenite/antimonite-responsive transcriptional repressor